MEIGHELSEPSYGPANEATWQICAGTTVGTTIATTVGALAEPIQTMSIGSAVWPLTVAPIEDLASDPRLENVPTTFLKHATLLDPPKPFPTYYLTEPSQLVKTATLKLGASALTRLISVVDTDEVWVGNAYNLVGSEVVSETQTRRWFQGWNSVVAPAAFAGGLTRARLLELLREARRRLRAQHTPRPRPVAAASRIRQQLDRLANFISPHAPPGGLLFQSPARAVVPHLTALA